MMADIVYIAIILAFFVRKLPVDESNEAGDWGAA